MVLAHLKPRVTTHRFYLVIHTDEEELRHHPKFKIQYYYRTGYVSIQQEIRGNTTASASGIISYPCQVNMNPITGGWGTAYVYYTGSIVFAPTGETVCYPIVKP